jgi:hypothetical protein
MANRMNLKDFFRSKKQPQHEPAGGFWAVVRWLCKSHVENTVAHFRSKGWSRLDWAESRYRALITPEALDRLIREARHLLTENDPKGVVMPGPIFRTGSWTVTLSVFPSTGDDEFLSACPGKSYEQFALQVRAFFRDQVGDWENVDFAHWLLLVDESKPDAVVHLHTIWSLQQFLRWISAPTCGQQGTLTTAAPCIVPVDLIRTDPSALIDRILREDTQCRTEQENRNGRLLAGQLAKVLLMDSITADAPLSVPNPLDVPGDADVQLGSVLAQACHKHAEDCQQLNADIPLVLGVPQGHLRACKEQLAAAGYHGLKPKQVSWLPEMESPLFCIEEQKVTAREDTGRFLVGGGNTVLMSMASPLWSCLWNRGIRWVLFGQLWNSGCRVDTHWLRAIATCQKDGLLECARRDLLPDSKLILLNKGEEKPQVVCVDDRRLSTETLQKLRVSANAVVGTGSFWVKLERLVSDLGLDPQRVLSRFDQDYASQSLQCLLQRDAILTLHSAGRLVASLPLWEILSSLDLQPIGVSPERFNLPA